MLQKARRSKPTGDPHKRLIVAISGASGAIYGVRLLELLQNTDIETHLVVSRTAKVTLATETNFKVSDVEALAARAGLREMQSFISKEEFAFESGEAFLDAPLIKDIFLDEWLAIIPAERRQEVSRRIVAIIDRERNETDFDVSIKATLIADRK